MTLVLTKELARKIEQSEIDTLLSRLNAIKNIKSNPMEVEVKRFGSATAFSAKNIPGPSFNTVKGLRDEDEKEVEKIIDFYQQKDIPVQFEITPANVSSSMLTHLANMGYYQYDFHTTLYAETSSMTQQNKPTVNIRELKENEFDLFGDIYVQGFQMPEFLKSAVARNNEVLYDIDNWNFYLASVGDLSYGIGVLFTKDRIANLAAAATVPKHRNAGIHKALIDKRVQQAKVLGCDFVVGQARYGSISQNNMEKAGMKVAYTKAVWIQSKSLQEA